MNKEILLYGASCCGLKGLTNVEDKSASFILEELTLKGWFDFHSAFVLLSFKTGAKNLTQFVKLIQSRKLGSLTITNDINGKTLVIWGVDIEGYKKYVQKKDWGYKPGDIVTMNSYMNYNTRLYGKKLTVVTSNLETITYKGEGIPEYDTKTCLFYIKLLQRADKKKLFTNKT